MEPTAQVVPVKSMVEPASNPIDRHVGGRVKMRRLSMGLSHETLAEMIGATVSELLQHENGDSRIDARRLLDISRALDVRALFFFGNLVA
jgi:transcriptional regulator with XRE-family HTH domain